MSLENDQGQQAPIIEPVAGQEQEQGNPFVQKLLTEKRNAMEAKRVLEEENRKLKEDRMREKEDLKGLLELRDKEVADYKARDIEREKMIQDSLKVSAIKKEFSKMGMTERHMDKGIRLVDISKLSYDPDTRVVVGAELQAKYLYEDMPELFGKVQTGVNQAAPVGGPSDLTKAVWLKLPPKEQKERYLELRGNLQRDGIL